MTQNVLYYVGMTTSPSVPRSRVFDLSQDDLDREAAAAAASNGTSSNAADLLPPLPSPKRSTSTAFESRFPMNAGITGYVAATGESVNIRNAYDDDRFDPAVDSGSGFRHRTILAMPIKYAGAPPGGKVLGVFQLVNKVNLPKTRVGLAHFLRALLLNVMLKYSVPSHTDS